MNKVKFKNLKEYLEKGDTDDWGIIVSLYHDHFSLPFNKFVYDEESKMIIVDDGWNKHIYNSRGFCININCVETINRILRY